MRSSLFRCHQEPFDASAVVHSCSSSRCLPDPLIADRFRSRFPPRLLTGMTLRRFGISACTAIPEDLPPSLAQHGSCSRSSTSSSLSFQDTHRIRLSTCPCQPVTQRPDLVSPTAREYLRSGIGSE